MKLVIQTQQLENYGTRWKGKGGATYVVENLDWMNIEANRELAKKVCDLVSVSDDGWREYVLDWSFEEDNAVVCDDWDAPYILKQDGNNWIVSHTHRPYGNTHLFTSVYEKWVRDAEFNVVEGSYDCRYLTKRREWLTEAEAVALTSTAA